MIAKVMRWQRRGQARALQGVLVVAVVGNLTASYYDAINGASPRFGLYGAVAGACGLVALAWGAYPDVLCSVVRVELAPGRTYAYRCRGCRRGDLVRVPTPHGEQLVRVVGHGRRLWWGRLKTATRVGR